MEGDLAQLLIWVVAGVGGAVGGLVGLAVLRARARRRRGDGSSQEVAASRTLREGLFATRRRLGERLDTILGGGGEGEALLQDIEEALIGADVGVRTSARLIARLREETPGRVGAEAIRTTLRYEIAKAFPPPRQAGEAVLPRVVLVTGVNGVGKTTTVGKLAAAALRRGERVLLVAADTYRAAAIEQLEAWGRRLGVEVVRHAAGASPAAVAFDGATAGRARSVDLVLVDTAGRLHTRAPLMDELKKVRRVLGQVCDGAPHETLLVLDATTGQNAISQARVFLEAVDVTGVVLTKLDGTAKGGVALAVADELGLPIAYVGVGEGAEDLRAFDASEYACALLGDAGSA